MIFEGGVWKQSQDPAWKARYDEGMAEYETEMVEDDVIKESWHDNDHINGGHTPD